MADNQSTLQLSERELQVLQLVVTGASNQEIARKLVISINTVKVHLRNIFNKLEVQSRTEATLRAIQEGLVTVTEDASGPANQPESSPIPATRTYLLETNRPSVLPRWQQFYLYTAILLVSIAVTLPLFPQKARSSAPQLPILYAQPTPLPQIQPEARTSRWLTHTPMPSRRAGLALVTFDQKIIAVGGVKDNSKATRSVEIYSPETAAWTEGTSKPTAVFDISGVVLDDKIYIPGGCTNQGKAVTALEVYQPESDRWRKGKPMPEARCGYGLVAFQDKLYLFGGWDGEAFTDTIFLFSPDQNRWETLAQTLPQPLGYMGVAVLDDEIYIAGGYNGEDEFSTTYAFMADSGAWREIAPLQEKRGGLGLIGYNQKLYAIGGGWIHPLSHSEKYDPATDSWTTFEAPLTGQWRNPGIAVMDTEIYAVGGWDGEAEIFMDSVVSYQLLFQLFLPIGSSR